MKTLWIRDKSLQLDCDLNLYDSWITVTMIFRVPLNELSFQQLCDVVGVKPWIVSYLL